jgi:hypothetical protein
VETALLLPFILLLLVGMVQFGKITYVYYTLQKTLYAAGTYLAAAQGVNFCDDADTTLAAAKSFALTGSTDESAESQISGLTAEMIRVETECIDPNTQAVGQCPSGGCESAAGGPRPDFVVVSIPDGYPVAPRIPYLQVDPIPLRPQVRIPFGGT